MFNALTALLVGEAAAAAKRKAFAAALYLVAALFAIFAFGYALAALSSWLEETYTVRYPDLWIAAGLVIVAAPFAILGVRKQRQRPERDIVGAAAVIAAPTAIRATSRAVSPQVVAIVAVASLGVWVGRRLSKR
jgi:hypothetical protein